MKKYNTPKKIATLCLVVSGILLILGGSLAFYSYKATSDGYVSIEAEGLTFRYKEGTNHISLSNAMPVEDWAGMDSNITNYFEFEITSNNPTDLLIPYYVTARKTDDSDDIDDAIKVGIMEVETAQHDIYNPYEYFEMFEMLPSYNFALNDLDFEKVYNQGDVINNDTYTMVYVSRETFSTENECLNSEDYKEEEYYGGTPICALTDSGYVVETTYGIYDLEEECQENLDTYLSMRLYFFSL